MKAMIRKELVEGMPHINVEKETCESCLLGKQVRQGFPKATQYRASQVLKIIHRDLCGPNTTPTASKNCYIFVLIDDHSHYMWSVLMKEKGQAFEKFKRFKAMVEDETKMTIKRLRTDRGGEFTSNEFKDFYEISGIQRHMTAPYTPQQNGVVERRNQTLMEMTRSTHEDTNYLWGESV